MNLQKGQRIPISFQRLTVGIGWDPAKKGEELDLDEIACLLNDNKKLPSAECFVFYNNPSSADGSCFLTGDDRTGKKAENGDDEQILVDLTMVDSQITSIVFCASIYEADNRKQNFGQVKNLYIRICDADTGEEFCKFVPFGDFANCKSIELGRFYLYKGSWKFEAIGNGSDASFQGIVEKYC